jgi:hypothetical protein
MTNSLGPIDICCDAPPYPIVQSCVEIGIESPEDVRWCRLVEHRNAQSLFRQLIQFPPWSVIFDGRVLGEGPCTCGQMLPQLRHYVFTFATGEECAYYLGQCPRCRTVFWEEGQVA